MTETMRPPDDPLVAQLADLLGRAPSADEVAALRGGRAIVTVTSIEADGDGYEAGIGVTLEEKIRSEAAERRDHEHAARSTHDPHERRWHQHRANVARERERTFRLRTVTSRRIATLVPARHDRPRSTTTPRRVVTGRTATPKSSSSAPPSPGDDSAGPPAVAAAKRPAAPRPKRPSIPRRIVPPVGPRRPRPGVKRPTGSPRGRALGGWLA